MNSVPWKWQDPYHYDQRVHRTGDSAINTRMSQDMPPRWGPEMQFQYPFRVWKEEVYLWGLATRQPEERKGPLLFSQLTGVAASTIRHWLEETEGNASDDITD